MLSKRQARPADKADGTEKGINELLKVQDQMAWVKAMNNIRNRTEEIVLQELIYGDDVV